MTLICRPQQDWMNLLVHGPLEFSTSYNAALQLILSLVRRYRKMLSSDFIQNLSPTDVLLQICLEALFGAGEVHGDECATHALTQGTSSACRTSAVGSTRSLTEESGFWDWPCNRHVTRDIMQMCIERSKDRGLACCYQHRD